MKCFHIFKIPFPGLVFFLSSKHTLIFLPMKLKKGRKYKLPLQKKKEAVKGKGVTGHRVKSSYKRSPER